MTKSLFGKGIKLIPEAQYFWSEYNSINGKEEVMIGQKWIRRNELLKIDIDRIESLYKNINEKTEIYKKNEAFEKRADEIYGA